MFVSKVEVEKTFIRRHSEETLMTSAFKIDVRDESSDLGVISNSKGSS